MEVLDGAEKADAFSTLIAICSRSLSPERIKDSSKDEPNSAFVKADTRCSFLPMAAGYRSQRMRTSQGRRKWL